MQRNRKFTQGDRNHIKADVFGDTLAYIEALEAVAKAAFRLLEMIEPQSVELIDSWNAIYDALCRVNLLDSAQTASQEQDLETKERATSSPPIIKALRQIFFELVNQASKTNKADDLQDTLSTIRDALHRMTTAFAQEAIIREKIRQLDEEDAYEQAEGEDGGDESLDECFCSAAWIGDKCEGAIEDLLQTASLWKEIQEDLAACSGVETSAIEYECLKHRRRVTQLTLAPMARQLDAKRKQLELNAAITSGTTGRRNDESTVV
jgi:hypothetical protein